MPCEGVCDGQACHVVEGRWVSMPTDQASMPRGERQVGKHTHRSGKRAMGSGWVSMQWDGVEYWLGKLQLQI